MWRTTQLLKVVTVGTCLMLFGGCAVNETYVSSGAQDKGPIVIQVASAQNPDPFQAGQEAAQALQEKMGQTAPHTVVLAECFAEKSQKQQVLAGICSVFPKDIVFGLATYGSFSQQGCRDRDSLGLLGIGGAGIATTAALQRDLGVADLTVEENEAELTRRLRDGGAALTTKLERGPNDRLLVLMADAHSPKNQFLVEGAQQVTGKDFPITGGSANKNAGQTFVYFQGKMYADSAIALLLSGDFEVALSGKQAKENAKVISTAAQGTKEALDKMTSKPFSVLAFNCAGRKGKLDRIEDELAAIKGALGSDIPLFGAYCAGEIGPTDVAEKDTTALSGGAGWHVMFTVLGR
jgi:hypothetical protein